jgi:hypothetical protein
LVDAALLHQVLQRGSEQFRSGRCTHTIIVKEGVEEAFADKGLYDAEVI